MSVLRFTALYPSSVPSAVFDTIGCPFGLFSEPLEALSELLSPEFRAPRPFLQSSLRSLLVHGFGVSLTIICLISAFRSRIQDPGPSENHPGVENCITSTREESPENDYQRAFHGRCFVDFLSCPPMGFLLRVRCFRLLP